MKKKKSERIGFTLIELLAVIVILGLLMALAIPAISRYIEESREDTYNLHEADMKAAAANKMTECISKNTDGCVPAGGESKTVYLSELIDDKYSSKLRDPANTDNFCDAEKSYVVVTNSNNNVVELDYQVCLVCDGYTSDVCEDITPDNTCGADEDPTPPTCGDKNDSTIWTNSDRVVSVKCIDDGCGCTQNTYYKTFSSSTREDKVKIVDKAGRETECNVNVYVDKDAPECEVKVDSFDTLGANGWYGGDAPVVKLVSKSDSLSGVATYGLGTSKSDPDFNKELTYEVEPGISVVYGYVRDEAGNIGTCAVEVKYDPVIPTGEITFGYQAYPKDDLSTKTDSKIVLNSLVEEYKGLVGTKVYLTSSNALFNSNISVNGKPLVERTINAGVNQMYYAIPKGTYGDLTLNLGTTSNANKVSKLELITEDTTGFYTNENVKVYVTSQDSFSGDNDYSFDGGQTWQNSNEKTFTMNTDIEIIIRDSAGNESDVVVEEIKNIDKLVPRDASFDENGGTYTMNVGESSVKVSSKVTASDADATTSYSKSGVRRVEYSWTTTNREPIASTWVATTNGAILNKTSNGGANYLWIRTTDKAGNVTVTRSNDFNVGYQIKYNCNGGTGCPSNGRKVHGSAYTIPNTTPTRDGYTFMGWGTTASTHTASYGEGGQYKTDAPEELFAIWKKTLTFTFAGNGASLNATTKSCDLYNAEESCNITLPTISRDGFALTGFNTSASATSAASGWTSGANVSVTDSTTKDWYAITSKKMDFTFDANGATLNSTSASCTIRNNNSKCSITLPTITRSAYTKVGFNTGKSDTTAASGWTSGATIDVTKDTALKWYAITSRVISVTFNNNGGSTGGTTKTCTMYNTDSSCTITAPTISAPSTTPTVVGWGESANADSSVWNSGADKSVSSNDTFYAITKKNAVTLTASYNSNGGSGTTNSTNCTIPATYNGTAQGTSCTAKLATNKFTKDGYKFKAWGTSKSSTSGSSEGASVTLTADKTYYVVWETACGAFSFSPTTKKSNSFKSDCTGNTVNLEYKTTFKLNGCTDGLSGYLCYYNPDGYRCDSESSTYKKYYPTNVAYKPGRAGDFCFMSDKWVFIRSTECTRAHGCNSANQCDTKTECY